MIELSKQYNPREVEARCYKFWEEGGYFRAKVNPDKKPFTIVIPPPNVTGILHMGHALNNIYQDVLTRFKRMQGWEALWIPGTDHAGIATQNVVERQIAKVGQKRQDLGRDEFLKKVWSWKEQYGSTIIHQLKKIGASCDWERARFTMDPEYSKAVTEVFIQLYEKGLIYQGSYIINWCPRCQTALSDEEAEHRELDGNLYYIKYFLKPSPEPRAPSPDFITVATTRPETMLGYTAVAVNPKDKRYKNLIGRTVILPLMEREIKIIADDLIDPKFGTGLVKVTPAHDPNDYEMGKRHNLEFINIMEPNGVLNTNAGEYNGMDRFEAREAILEDLRERKLLEKVEPHRHAVGHCYRCHTIVEPYLSKQWFVKMQPLALAAIEAVKFGKIKFYPKRWTKVYLNWMENIRDWCISRQIWWGHRIPVFYCRNCQKTEMLNPKSKNQNSKLNEDVIVAKIKPEKCPQCGSGDIYQDEDVLDTWFSSWLWPFATFKHKGELAYFYPTSVLVTAPEIIFFWVARMIMAGFEFMGKEPFHDIYIHGTVRDDQGRKMSKSLGNSIDPLGIIDKYGADAMRFSLMFIASTGQDVFLSENKFEMGRNFANKLWNAARFSLMNFDSQPLSSDLGVLFKNEKLGLADRWILSRFYSMLISLDKALESYRFNDAANLLYEFIWHEFCDWYLELAKPTIAISSQFSAFSKKQKETTQVVLYKVLEKTLRCLHPFMPFVTEEIWQKLSRTPNPEPRAPSIMTQSWPHIQKQMIDKKAEGIVQVMIELITAVRNLKAQIRIPEPARVKVNIVVKEAKSKKLLEGISSDIINLAKLENLNIVDKEYPFKNCVSAVSGDWTVFMELEGLIDVKLEQERIAKEISSLRSAIAAKENLLKNKNFLSRAPEDIVVKEKAGLADMREKIVKLEKILAEF